MIFRSPLPKLHYYHNKRLQVKESQVPYQPTVRHGKTGGSVWVRVGSIGSQVKTGHGSKRVIFKQVNRVIGQTGRGLSQVASRVELTRIFHFFFFFFFKVDAICQLFMGSLTIIRFSLVILLPITTKHLT